MSVSLSEKFASLKKLGRMAFMPYICVGDPNAKASVKIAETLVEAGADVLELGLPFSDPIADGPTIQRASQRALSAGMNTDEYFKVCARISKDSDASLVSMTYYNLILQYGIEKFVSSCVEAGVSGVIVPDLPIEECRELEEICKKYGVSLIQLVALTTDEARLGKIISHANGFVYLVSVLGVTGARDKLGAKVSDALSKIKEKTNTPVCLGFGISRKEQVEEAKKMGFSGVIIGSALIDVIEKNLGDADKMLDELSKIAGQLSSAR